MTTTQKTLNDSNAHLIQTLTGKKPKRTDLEIPLWFGILKDALTPKK